MYLMAEIFPTGTAHTITAKNYNQGETMYRVISADESLNPKDVTSINAYVYDYFEGYSAYNHYNWYIRNKKI